MPPFGQMTSEKVLCANLVPKRRKMVLLGGFRKAPNRGIILKTVRLSVLPSCTPRLDNIQVEAR
jgi:hypothetical protein